MQELNSCISLENENIDEVTISPEQFGSLLRIQQAILELIAVNFDKDSALAKLCSLAEAILPNSVASIMLLDPSTGLMSVVSAPSVPQVGIDALQNLKPGPGGGSCGNAVFHNEPMYVKDTFTDDRWTDLRQLAYDFNLCACWSMPIRNEDKKAYGSFALSSFEHRSPSSFHKLLLEIGSSLVGVILKHDEQVRTIAQKQASLELAHTAIENAVEAVIVTDANNKIILVNKAGEDIFGYPENSILGENPKLFSSGRHDALFYTKMWDSLHENRSWSGEIWNKRASGEIFPQRMSIRAIYDESGTIINYVAVMMDISEHKEAEQKLENINKNLENLVAEEVAKNRQKDALLIKQSRQAAMGEMIANIAHQWRQPLNALGITIQDAKMAWQYGEIDEEYVNGMVKDSMKLIKFMSQTIDDFRTFFKPDKQKTNFSLHSAIMRIKNLLITSLEAYKIELEAGIPDDIFIYGYENELAQALLNIIDNAKDAIIENNASSPKISINAYKNEANCIISIQDNAGGIPSAIIDKIFEPYFTTKEQGKGTGIGLYMTKTIIEDNIGGKISAENIENGARLTILLPDAKSAVCIS
jgi:PAS domain S-box-containing protein